jgi:hypothetical protein
VDILEMLGLMYYLPQPEKSLVADEHVVALQILKEHPMLYQNNKPTHQISRTTPLSFVSMTKIIAGEDFIVVLCCSGGCIVSQEIEVKEHSWCM